MLFAAIWLIKASDEQRWVLVRRLALVAASGGVLLAPLILAAGRTARSMAGASGMRFDPTNPLDLILIHSANLYDVILPNGLHPLWGSAVESLVRTWHPYIGGLFSFGVLLRGDDAPAVLWGWQVERGALWVLWLLAMLWLGDSGAYFVGRAIGRRKLAPTLSPAKTVEGAVANLALCLLVGWQGGVALGLPLGWAIAGGLGVGILGQLGDLFESALKRAVGVKDFGGILPGHGGVLDRFDSFLFSAPWVWWIVQNAAYRP